MITTAVMAETNDWIRVIWQKSQNHVLTVTDIQRKDLKPNVIHTPYFGDDSPTFRNEPGKRNEEF